MSKKLSTCKPGYVYRIIEINGSNETQEFLENIGLEIGDPICVISKIASNYIINVKDGRFGIDEGVAKLVVVQ